MTSQNVPGVAVLRASGYQRVPVSPVIAWTGLVKPAAGPVRLLRAINLAAITAAICTGRGARRPARPGATASVFAGGFYLLVGLFGATVGALFAAFPRELVLAIAGMALLAPGGGLATAMKDESQREPAPITFLVTASGVALWGIGSAFGGVVAGTLALLILRPAPSHLSPAQVCAQVASPALSSRACLPAFGPGSKALAALGCAGPSRLRGRSSRRAGIAWGRER